VILAAGINQGDKCLIFDTYASTSERNKIKILLRSSMIYAIILIQKGYRIGFESIDRKNTTKPMSCLNPKLLPVFFILIN